MSGKKEKRVYKLCPCDRGDVEGIQSWLEDMALEGLLLEEDGQFCGVFTFRRSLPKRVTYRLDVAQKRKSSLFDSGAELSDEELEIYRSMGWEYLVQYGDFRIYRAEDQKAPELNTEPQTHAFTISLLKKNYRGSFVTSCLTALFWLLYSQGGLGCGFRLAVALGLFFAIGLYGILLRGVIVPLLHAFRFRRYEKRLLSGDTLTHRVEWRKTAAFHIVMRVLPMVLGIGLVFGLLSGFVNASKEYPNKDYPGDPPFATVADVFPGGTVTNDNVWLDYGTYLTGQNSISRSVEWNESCDVVTAAGEKYFCAFRISYHETVTEWIAKGLEEDYYDYDSTRYHGKRFQDLEAPDLGVDSVRVYTSYGTLNVLMRQGNRVVHGVIVLDDDSGQNQWLLWARAMAEQLKN